VSKPFHDGRSRALLITGVIGSGKTSVATEIAATLDQTDSTYALIDLDFLCWAKPAPDCELTIHDLLVMNLVPVIHGFQSAGISHFILPRLILTRAEAEQLRGGLTEAAIDDVTIVELTVSTSSALHRLERRDHGATLESHRELLTMLVIDEGTADIGISTENRSISDVASDVLKYWTSGR
jgi:gluconate kinase